MHTKERILTESMKLFSVYGYTAVSIRMIAKEVGVESSALYKHFKNKQAIFDAIVQRSEKQFFQKYDEMSRIEIKRAKDLEELCLTMFRFQTQDSWTSSFRKLLLQEKFAKPEIAAVYKKIFVDMPVQHQRKILEELIRRGILRDANAEVMSLELYAPFYVYHIIEEDPKYLEDILRTHVNNFLESYVNKVIS